MRQRYKKPQIEVILPYQELMDVVVQESGGGTGPGGGDNPKPGDPDLAKQWKFSVWDDEEESSDVWN